MFQIRVPFEMSPCPPHRIAIWNTFQDEDTGVLFAIGVCHYCHEQLLMTCLCGETFNVLKGLLICPTCDEWPGMVCQPTNPNTNEGIWRRIEKPDETEH